MGKRTLKIWSRTQSLVVLSSGESEFYAARKESAEGLGMKAVAADLGIQVDGEVWGDASAALEIIKRKGLGRTRHIDIGLLWIQQTAAEGRLKYHKALGTDNPADLMTKYLDIKTIDRHTGALRASFPGGRANTAPTLHSIAQRTSWPEALIEEEEELSGPALFKAYAQGKGKGKPPGKGFGGKANIDEEVVYARPPKGYETFDDRSIMLVWWMHVPRSGQGDAGLIWFRTTREPLTSEYCRPC